MSNDDTNPTTPEPTDSTPASQEPEQLTPAPAPAAPPAPAPRRRTGLVVAGVAAAVILSAGVGAAFALALSDDDDDDVTGFNTSSNGQTNGGGNGFDGPDGGGPTAANDETDLDGMLAAASQAVTVAQGDVVKIEERSPGTWKVEVQGGGREYEVVVDGSGARVVEEDDDDDGDDLPLTADSVSAIVEAANANTAGRVVQVESDDNRYKVEIRTSSGSTVGLDLDTSFQVVGSDRDDDDDDGFDD
ncbi:PepSY domain-containing protein [Aeromicrobium alkaliterrae]|uniref:PepSY domain-containing protein n=1 Tax=Aeromicrobium alkaliterrae TaxID=302168 RepID=A0ABN2JEB0_9ACTN